MCRICMCLCFHSKVTEKRQLDKISSKILTVVSNQEMKKIFFSLNITITCSFTINNHTKLSKIIINKNRIYMNISLWKMHKDQIKATGSIISVIAIIFHT